MARMPVPGADEGTWGDVLNDFLAAAHNSDGSIKDAGVVAAKYVKPGSGIPESDLAAAVQTKLNADVGTDTAAQPGTSTTVGTSSAQLVAANADRFEIYIYNTSTNGVVYLSLGGTAVVGSGARINPGGDYFYSRWYDGAISAISTEASTAVAITEV